jgi:hypothetical protein
MTEAPVMAHSIEAVFGRCLALAMQVLNAPVDQFERDAATALTCGIALPNVRCDLDHAFRLEASARFAWLFSKDATERVLYRGRSSLCLLGFEETDHQAVKSSLANAIAASIEVEFKPLNRNFTAVLDRGELGDSSSPFSASLFLHAATGALEGSDMSGSRSTDLLLLERPAPAASTSADVQEGQLFSLRSTIGPQKLAVKQPDHVGQRALYANEEWHCPRAALVRDDRHGASPRHAAMLRPKCHSNAHRPAIAEPISIDMKRSGPIGKRAAHRCASTARPGSGHEGRPCCRMQLSQGG